MISLRSLALALPQVPRCHLHTSSLLSAGGEKNLQSTSKAGSIWRLPQYDKRPQMVWPNYTKSYTHNKHRRNQAWYTWGLQKQSKCNVVDNSALGRQAMAEGKPPMIFHVYSRKHSQKFHGAYAKLGDRVTVAIMGQKKKAIIVGMKQKQVPNVPRYDSNNCVLIEENGNPTATRITAPLPNCIRPGLLKASDPKIGRASCRERV